MRLIELGLVHKVLLISGISIAITGCLSSIDPGMELSEPSSSDKEYYASYQGATRGGDLIRNFGLEFRIHATYLYPEYRAQLAKRLKTLYLQDAGAFTEADSKSGFFVTVFGSERDSTDLSNTNHWTLLLEGKDGPIRPVLVRKITDKKRWRNFFESVTPWTADYLLVFDTPAANPGAANLVEKPHAKLIIATGEGKTTMNW
ncbi:MAG: hypothetical protein NTV34_02570 [Proteobacteria bacterium]|nr:hypothetical protein [Pseudomonadota bacterium]